MIEPDGRSRVSRRGRRSRRVATFSTAMTCPSRPVTGRPSTTPVATDGGELPKISPEPGPSWPVAGLKNSPVYDGGRSWQDPAQQLLVERRIAGSVDTAVLSARSSVSTDWTCSSMRSACSWATRRASSWASWRAAVRSCDAFTAASSNKGAVETSASMHQASTDAVAEGEEALPAGQCPGDVAENNPARNTPLPVSDQMHGQPNRPYSRTRRLPRQVRPATLLGGRPMQSDQIDEHKVILGALLFFLAMAIYAALGFQP